MFVKLENQLSTKSQLFKQLEYTWNVSKACSVPFIFQLFNNLFKNPLFVLWRLSASLEKLLDELDVIGLKETNLFRTPLTSLTASLPADRKLDPVSATFSIFLVKFADMASRSSFTLRRPISQLFMT